MTIPLIDLGHFSGQQNIAPTPDDGQRDLARLIIELQQWTVDHQGWDDAKFPFIGQRIDTAGGRLNYNYTDPGVNFAQNALYQESDQVTMIHQLSHRWKFESDVKPHIHWTQASALLPNFLLEYRVYKLGGTKPAVWTKAVSTPVFSYPGGTISQISSFPDIDMAGIDAVSAITEYKFFRDTTNASGEFAGADPLSASVDVQEFDVHFFMDTPQGSKNVYSK
jgi:hypothetical protein